MTIHLAPNAAPARQGAPATGTPVGDPAADPAIGARAGAVEFLF